jgi:hypothetical protein
MPFEATANRLAALIGKDVGSCVGSEEMGMEEPGVGESVWVASDSMYGD